MFSIYCRAAMAVLALTTVAFGASTNNNRPNIVFILTDDQDKQLGSMDNMAVLQDLIVKQGTTFNKHYGHVSQCCPSRATLWTGKHAHNTNITDVVNSVPGGAWKHIQMNGWADKYLPVWMQENGYTAYYTGKIYNGYNLQNYQTPVALGGFTKADILVDPTTYTYRNSFFVHNEGDTWDKPARQPGYSTDVITNFTLSYIDDAVNNQDGKPFFVVAAPIAPHISIGPTYPNNNTKLPYPFPKPEYRNLFPKLQVPRNPNFNPDNRTGVAGVWALDQLSDSNVGFLDEYYRKRQQCLQSVDDMIQAVVNKLDDSGVLDNTYIIYSTDNGYHIGQHRLQPGKKQCFEEDVNIPLVIRGPTVAKGQSTDLVTGHIDMAPTILQLAGIELDPAWKLDGQAISFPLETQDDFDRNFADRGELVHLEFWGPFSQEAMFKDVGVDLNVNLQTYKALRLQGDGYNLMYSVWCQNASYELYDMSWDPYQMTNLHPYAPAEDGKLNAYWSGMDTLLGRPTEQVVSRLDALVLVQKSCSGDSCRNPWQQLHPTHNISTITDALHHKYDGYYDNSMTNFRVGWKQCYIGHNATHSSSLYNIDNEQPMWTNLTVATLVQNTASGQERWCGLWRWALGWMGLMVVVGY